MPLFEIYVKLLIEYFKKSIEYDPESIIDLPKGYNKLFKLADAVVLGKALIATIIAKKHYFSNGYRTKTLIIQAPVLAKGWKKQFEILKCRCRFYYKWKSS